MSKRKPVNERSLINQKIRQVRKSLKLTQEEVAQKMGMKVDTYSKKERFGNITIDWAMEFAKAVNVDPAIFSSVFETPKPINFGAEKGEIFKVNAPIDFIDKIYGTPKENKPEIKKEEDKNKLPFILSTTEKSLVETFHYLSKQQQNEILAFANEVKERGK